MHVVLPLTVTPEKPGRVTLMMAEDFSSNPTPRSIELSIEISGKAQPRVTINGAAVPSLRRSDDRMTAELQAEPLIRGRNQLKFSVERDEVTVSRVEIRVSYTERRDE